MVYGSGLENQRVSNGTVGSNPTLSVSSIKSISECPVADRVFFLTNVDSTEECLTPRTPVCLKSCVADGGAPPERFDHGFTLPSRAVISATQPIVLSRPERTQWMRSGFTRRASPCPAFKPLTALLFHCGTKKTDFLKSAQHLATSTRFSWVQNRDQIKR